MLDSMESNNTPSASNITRSIMQKIYFAWEPEAILAGALLASATLRPPSGMGGAPRYRHHVAGVDGFSATRAHKGGHRLGAASAMHQRERGPFFAAQPGVAPSHHREHHRIQVHPLFGQAVFDPGVFVLAFGAFENLVGHQGAQPGGEDIASNPGITLELIEAVASQKRLPQDQHRPSLADYGQRSRNRTIRFTGRTPSHRSCTLPRANCP